MKDRSPIDDVLALAGRLMIATLFLPAGVGKLANLDGTVGLLASKGLPFPFALALCTVALEVVASLALLAGFKTRWAALALAAFTVVAGLIFHDFWASATALEMAQRQAFFKNIGIAGGLLLLAAWGPGRISVEGRRG